jgi:three-Cys-motif partner protein
VPPRKLPDVWLDEKLRDLVELGTGLETPGESTFLAKPWTLLKLACLRYYVPIYLNILRQRFERLAFVDLYSAAGASIYPQEDFRTIVPGSSVIAADGANRGSENALCFDELVAIDLSAENLLALERNLRRWGFDQGRNLFPIQSESTRLANVVGKHLSERPRTHALIFADADALEPPFDALKAIVKDHDAVDLVLLHLVSGAAMSNSPEALSRYYGCDPPAKPERETLSKLYVQQLEHALRPPGGAHRPTVVEKVRITGGSGMGGYCYDLVFAWRETKGGTPFAAAIRSLRSKVESLTGDDVRHIMSTICGSQRRLDRDDG